MTLATNYQQVCQSSGCTRKSFQPEPFRVKHKTIPSANMRKGYPSTVTNTLVVVTVLEFHFVGNFSFINNEILLNQNIHEAI